jgi:hypothetical protein
MSHDVYSTPQSAQAIGNNFGKMCAISSDITDLICMYCPVATAAGEANLAIDSLIAEGCWTATESGNMSVCFSQSRGHRGTYAVAATVAQSSERT